MEYLLKTAKTHQKGFRITVAHIFYECPYLLQAFTLRHIHILWQKILEKTGRHLYVWQS